MVFPLVSLVLFLENNFPFSLLLLLWYRYHMRAMKEPAYTDSRIINSKFNSESSI